ncbi:MAG: leucyl aminopeptidase [Burkholderiales bacterium]|nr:leucyl aminopeptidase [Bacteroidia bacterium]
MTVISKKKQTDSKQSLAILCSAFKNKSEYALTKEQADYISRDIKVNEKKFICINTLSRFICVVLVDDKKNHYTVLESIRKNGATITDHLNSEKLTAVSIVNELSNPDFSLALAEGMALANYQFIKHKPTAKKKANTLASINVVDDKATVQHIDNLSIAVDATLKARDLVNEPVNTLNATDLADAFKTMGKSAGFKVEVFNKAKIKQLKMGGLLAVNQGSVDPPTFTVMEYKPKNPKNKRPYVLVGKGVVYDTGGLSLKPTPNSMDLMKCDMAGGAAVGCTMYAIAKAKLNVHVIALVPATDNRPGFNAFAPGDIITMMDGSTVEMLNSDAEGRMILADALHYAKRYKPEMAIELSTLTGAAMAAIGQYGIVSMGTATDEQKMKLTVSGLRMHERLAEFPFWDEYDELIKSDIADQKNLGGPYGGAITAGKFLVKYTDYPYMHFDIAGPAFIGAKDSYRGKGGTGYGVRLLFDFFSNL